uniref:Serine carboxypeptidase-like 18 n=1 Tax=Kalanchoe fedtschenkoi TaxID=63787 RepID=A0A7N0ZS18_KALFE
MLRYVGVGRNDEIQLFYYFIESQRDPVNDPLFLWLNGGPGCSGLSGMVYEIGPIQFDYLAYNGSLPTMIPNPYAFTQVASIIFLDSPFGTGFSYSTAEASFISTDISTAGFNYQFLQKWLRDHRNFLQNPLYITGDSYAGMIIPILLQEIRKGAFPQTSATSLFFLVIGYVLGNPVTNRSSDNNMIVPYAHRLALLSDELYESARVNCNGDYSNRDNNTMCTKDLEAVHKCTEAVYGPHVLNPVCPVPVTDNITDAVLIDILRRKKPWCRDHNYVLSARWANDPRVQEALGVRRGTKDEWLRCNRTSYDYKYDSVVECHRSFLDTSYRALIYRLLECRLYQLL